MVVAVGIDVIEIARIRDALERTGDRFRYRVFTQVEVAYCESQAARFASYAARFAAKEAAMKALGRGWFDGVRWVDIEVVRGEPGPPSLRLGGRALERMQELGADTAHVSLSHSRELAIAQVLLETG